MTAVPHELAASERSRQQWYADMYAPHTQQDLGAAREFFAANHESWFPIDGKLSISREEATGERYDITQGGWAFI